MKNDCPRNAHGIHCPVSGVCVYCNREVGEAKQQQLLDDEIAFRVAIRAVIDEGRKERRDNEI